MNAAPAALPRVSVVIPTFNRAALVGQAIQSVLAQTVSDLEVIIVDDGSTDATAETLAAFQGEPRLRLVRQPNAGRAAARNHGARLARGEFLGFLDSDDRYPPTALAAHLAVFETRADLGLTLGGYAYLDEGGGVVGARAPHEGGGGLDAAGWLFDCYAMPGSVLLRRSWFERAGGFDPACEIAEDWDLFLRLARLGCPMAWVRETVCEYRQHAGNSVRAISAQRAGALRMLDKFFAQPDLPGDIAALENSARAWLRVVFAKRAYAAGESALGAADLRQAVALDPAWAGRRRLTLLEFLLAPEAGAGRGVPSLAPQALRGLPAEIRLHRGDLARAQARVEIGQYFAARRRCADSEALRHLRAALRLDPRWLANRGVLAFALRSVSRALGLRARVL